MMMNKSRAVWIVLDGVGLAAAPDAREYGDENAATLPHVAEACGGLTLPNLQALGLGNLADIKGVPPLEKPIGAYGRMAERSAGKDSIIGHWELAGLILDKPFATFPRGFPEVLVEEFAGLAGGRPLCNMSASGITVLEEYGSEHIRTGRPILYTSVDSVFQVAVHEDVMSPDDLHELCRATRPLADRFNIARVIARPFLGNEKEGFRRSPLRKDFPVIPPRATLLESLYERGYTVSAVGKISDLFAGRGITCSSSTTNNADGMAKILDALVKLESGLLMANLIDFDMVYGHRNDAVGFGAALEEFDAWLPELLEVMCPDDLLVISADHGCDPTTPGTDHSREYVPLLIWSKSMKGGLHLGDRRSFSDVAATLAAYFRILGPVSGEGFEEILKLQGGLNL